MFLGWYDADRKKPARQKVAEAIERYVEKFGSRPELCLTNPTDADELGLAHRAFPNPPAVPVERVGYIPRWTFYVGVRDEVEEPLAA